MKLLQKLAIAAGALLLLCALLFVGARYGWRLFGFRFCDGATVTAVSVTEDTVTITGSTPSFFGSVVGYCAEEEDGVLYFGVKVNHFWGVWVNDLGQFSYEIPVEGEIHTVCYRTDRLETTLWTESDGFTGETPD